MGSNERIRTVVLNLMDGREEVFSLSARQAVVAASEKDTRGIVDLDGSPDPSTHPDFREHRLGFSCGDWIAYKDDRLSVTH